MARARNIKPGFFTNEELVELPFSTRLLFIGLWTVADREGRLEDKPKRIKMHLFPADDIDVDAALNELQASGFLARYEVDGDRFIQVLAFRKHQNPHRDEKVSLIPPMGGHSASTVQAPDSHGGNPADSPIPDSPIPDPLNIDTTSASAPASAAAVVVVPAEPDNPRAAALPPREEPTGSTDPAIVLAVALRKLGVDATFTHPAVQDWATRKIAMDMLLAAVALAREQKGPTAKIAPNYLVPIVEKLLNPPAASAPAFGKPVVPIQIRKPQGMDPKGTDESYEEYDARIAAAELARRKGTSQ